LLWKEWNKELHEIIHHCVRFCLPLLAELAETQQKDTRLLVSTLARLAEFVSQNATD
jgi:hypothetical protein